VARPKTRSVCLVRNFRCWGGFFVGYQRHNPGHTASHAGERRSGPGFQGERACGDCRRGGRRERVRVSGREGQVRSSECPVTRPPPLIIAFRELALMDLRARIPSNPCAAYNPREAVDCHGEVSP
jgi:hypothetical protein